jgi:two-component system sensor histidine kinase ChvG
VASDPVALSESGRDVPASARWRTLSDEGEDTRPRHARPRPFSGLVRLWDWLRRLSASLTFKLVLLIGVFCALPILLYGQFENADRTTRELVTRALQHRSELVAEALRPILAAQNGAPQPAVAEALAKFAGDGTKLQLMLRPASSQAGGFFYVASAPASGSAEMGAQLDGLKSHGVLDKLEQSCSWDKQQEFRYVQPSGQEEVLTSVVPILTAGGCWVLVSSHVTTEYLDSSIGRPYWQTREIRIAAIVYLGMAGLAMLAALSVRRNLQHFRDVAREVRSGRAGAGSFAAQNILPELSSVAEDFDMLVHDLGAVAEEMRRTAEDNAHSVKGPIATIQSSLEPLRPLVPPGNARAGRALELIDASLARLKELVAAAQTLDNHRADLLASPRPPVDLTRVVGDLLGRYRELLAARDVTLVRRLDDKAIVRAGSGVLEVVVENILANAISFAPPGSSIAVLLAARGRAVELRIEDEGPGIDPAQIDRVFERYYSQRPANGEDGSGDAPEEALEAGHSGLGLWIARRDVEALGGRVALSNRSPGGLSVRITLPNGSAGA